MTKTLYKTIIGSHAWRMDTPESDIDYFVGFQIPTKTLLRGGNLISKSVVRQVNETDWQESELGLVVHQLIKNNLNYMVDTMSPLIEESSPEHKELLAFFPTILSKELYYSFHGMAIHNLKLFHRWWGDGIPPAKFGKIGRVLDLGIRLLNGEDFIFRPSSAASESDILKLIKEIDYAHNNSTLPDTCPIRNEILDWLVDKRLNYLED